jgi:hypothetical protein
MPDWGPLESAVVANPSAVGLAGLDAWIWLDPAPAVMTVDESLGGIEYRVTADPVAAAWDFGDGATERDAGAAAFGVPFPRRSTVTHMFQSQSRTGYVIRSSVAYEVSWSALEAGRWLGPYPLGTVSRPAIPLIYPVEQAQPEVVRIGP